MICHISHSSGANDGGIAIAVGDLIEAQKSAGLNAQWLTADRITPIRRDYYLYSAVQTATPAILHLHGLWRSPTRVAPFLARAGLPLMIAPHGMLDSGALAISYRKKQLVWHSWERRALQASRCLHALCPSEAQAIRVLFPGASIAVIPNGVQLPAAEDPSLPAPPWAAVIPTGAPVLLFFGRFHAKKGVEPLLHAWHALTLAVVRSGWWLALVGYGDNGSLQRYVVAAQARGELPQLFVGGPAFGLDKAAVLHGASAFVLPSFSEGLPMAALEAMAHQLPCLLSSACNLPEAFDQAAALRAEPNPEALAQAIGQLFSLTERERMAMGESGRALVAQNYSWPQVAAQTLDLYNWILGGGEQPPFVS